MRRFLKFTRRIERSWFHYVCGDTRSPTCWHILHVMCIPVSEPQFGMVLWLRVPQHPVTSIQPLNCQWLLPDPDPDPHWTTSPSLLTNMLKFRSTLRTWVHNCTIWFTVSNNWVYWWPVLPGRCWQISAAPHLSSLCRSFCCDHYSGTQ